ncbi:MAG: copper resistance protein CopC [Leucobacter sp.]
MSIVVNRVRRLRGPRSVVLALFALFAGVLVLLGTGISPASAHAELVNTTPEQGAVLDAAPEAVELRFSEAVQLIDGAMRLFPGTSNSTGEGADSSPDPMPDPVDLDASVAGSTVTIELPGDLPDGAYAVSYRLVSADGHPVGGALTFQIGKGNFAAPTMTNAAANPAVTEVLVAVLTAIQYLGLLGFAGLLFFEHVVLRSIRGRGEVPDPLTRKLLRNTFGAAAIAALLLIPASGSRVTGSPFITFNAETGDFILLPVSGWWPGVSGQVIASAVLITVCGWVALIIGNRARRAAGSPGRPVSPVGKAVPVGRAALMSLVLAGVALVAPVLVGHTQTVQPTWMMLIADTGHLVAGAFWVGGVIGLLRFLVISSPAAGGDEPRVAPAKAAQVVADFSRYAFASVILLAVSGVLMGVLVVGTWEKLVVTDYGHTLLIKLGVVAVVVALAAYNRTRLVPHLMLHHAASRQWVSLKRIMVFELVVLSCVLVITGFLSNTTPNLEGDGAPGGAGSGSSVSADTNTEPETVRAEAQGLAVEGALTPATTGENVFTFTLEYEGEAVTPDSAAFGKVTVDARMPEQQLGPIDAEVDYDPASEEYEATVTLPVTGDWQLQVAARVDTYTQPIVVLPITVK